MSLPKIEYLPDDPELLPPARRRRARRLLAPLDVDEHTLALDRVAHRTSPSFDFFLFSLIAGLVFGLGFWLDSTALLVLGAVLSPLMGPIVGLALGTVTGSGRFFARSLVGLAIGSLLVFAAAALIGLIARIGAPLALSQAHTHAQLSGLSFVLLIVGAALTAVMMVNPGRNPAAPSVALAYTIYLPLAVAGFGLTHGASHLWPDGLVLYAIHLAWTVLIGAVILAVLGFRPLTLFGYTLGGAVALVGVILLIGFSGISAVLGAFGAPLAVPTPTFTPTLTPTPVPPTATLTSTPVPPTVTPTPTLSPTSTTTPTPTITPTPVPIYALIDAEFGGGAVLRSEPGGSAIITLMNGTRVQLLTDPVIAEDGKKWVYVLWVAEDIKGWLLDVVLTIATPEPGW